MPSSQGMMPNGHQVLVIANDAFAAALIGSLVETVRLRAAFVAPGERPEDALMRVRPLAVILLDAESDQLQSDVFVARARRGGVQLLMFGSARDVDQRMAWADERGIPTFALPDEVEALQAALEAMARPAPRNHRRGERRQASLAVDEALVFEDSGGTRWSVYDRRTTDRRAAMVERKFISESGDIRHCFIASGDAAQVTVEALSGQLERALATP